MVDNSVSRRFSSLDTETIGVYSRNYSGNEYKTSNEFGNVKPRKHLEEMKTASGDEPLLNEIIEILNSPDCQTPSNILLLGKTGSGKSSLINTVHKAITGRYYKIATQGTGNGQSVTLDLIRYDNCGVSLHRISDEYRRNRMESVVPKLPHIWDCAGLGNENTPKLRELLELLIGGYIRPGTSIEALEELQQNYGIGRLKKILGSPNPLWKVSKIAFLVACTEVIPKNLIACLKGILKIYDRKTLIRKYQCEVYVVITRYDYVQDSGETNLHGTSTENAVSREDFQSIEDSIAAEFSFSGAVESHILRWISLTDNVGYDRPDVERTALEYLKRMVEPGVPRTADDTPIINEDYILRNYRFVKVTEEVVGQLLIVIQQHYDHPLIIFGILTFVVIICSALYKLLNADF